MVRKNYKLPTILNTAKSSAIESTDVTVGETKSNEVNTFKRLPDADRFRPGQQPTEAAKQRISYWALFRYATIWDYFIMALGVVVAVLAALGVPYAIVIYGEFTSLLIDRCSGIGTSSPAFILQLFGGGVKLTNASHEVNMQAIKDDSIAFGIGTIVGATAEMLLLALAVDLLNRVALKQITIVRKLFLEAMLRQEMSWYDTAADTNFAAKMTENLTKMKDGMGESIVIFTFYIMTFVWGVVVSFIYGWELTLVVLICCPFIVLSTALVAWIQASLSEKELAAYSSAGSVAEEVFSGVRTVVAFSGERREVDRFSYLLAPAEQTGRKKGLYSGIGSGIMWFIIYASYAIALWYGVKLILADRYEEDRVYTPAVLLIVLFGIIMGAQSMGFATPFLESFAVGKAAAQDVYSVIDRRPTIDAMSPQGERPPGPVIGNLSFEDIHFSYPARADVQVLHGFTLQVPAGQTVALVGASGCGKSTALQLMQRFYDPLAGIVRLDGHNLRDVNVNWLRSQIGVVGQEPVLFATTIAANIRYGHPQATQEDIENAARQANCHDFITKLPLGYNTMVGERGAQMSGGQKQRIAIARALVRNPKVLLLDEATSALDPTSERRVQESLDAASKGRTTLVVSHRLATVTNADRIVFVKDGAVLESGTHEELIAKRGHYWQLVQISKRTEEEADDPYKGGAKHAVRVRTSDDESSGSESDSSAEPHPDEDVVSQNTEKGHKRKKKKQKKPKEEKYNITLRQLMQLNAPEWRYILVGCIASMLHGATFPVWAMAFGDSFGMLSSEDEEYVKTETRFLAFMFIIIGIIAGCGTLLQSYMFTTAGVKMTTRLRQRTFKTMLEQEVAFFDDERNSVGALCARLAGDCSNVQGATGSRIGIIVQAISTLLIGVMLSFFISWQLTLVALVTVPFVCLSIMFESRLMESSVHAEKLATERASQVAVEALSNIRTVASLTLENNVMSRYGEQIDELRRACLKKTRFRGLVFGLGQAAPFYAYGVTLFYGGMLTSNGQLPYEAVIKVSEALIFGSWVLGQTLAYAPNVSAAIMSAGRLMKLFERAPVLHNPASGAHNTTDKARGDITYEAVDFHYPNRKQIPVLQQLSLRLRSGTTTALVGPSGSGKSTCVQLLLRFYDPAAGAVALSGVPTTEFPFDTLRSQLGLVSQEPVLFDRTIAENIAYGNNFRASIPMAEIIAAATLANIHNFISSLPCGYETRLGSKGAQLSGGQKQRIAIARALVRNPQVLILDEATSALDMESEQVVQQALDKARHGRTCLVIAHRLTTVRDADLICVMKRGVLVEQGSHEELMEHNGIYAELYAMQQVS